MRRAAAALPRNLRSCHASYHARAARHQLLQRTRYAPPPTPAPRHIEPPRLHRLRRPSHDSAAPKRTATPMIASCPSLGTHHFTTAHSAPHGTRTRVTTPNRHLLLSTTTTPSILRSALLSSLSYVFLSGRHGGVLSRIRLSYGSTSVLSSSYSPPSWLPCPQDPTERFRSSLITAIHLPPIRP